MKTITELKIQTKDKNRANLYLDGKFFCGLDLETVVKNKLKVGTIITEEKIEDIQLQSEKQTAYTKALKLISVRYKTQKEVEKYLYEKGYLPQIVYYVVSKLLEYHYIDDERFVAGYIASHRARDGRIKIKYSLLQRGIKESIINEAFDDEFNQTEEIISLTQKYMKSKENSKENYLKLFKYLMSKGFEYEEIKSALKQEID